LYFFANGTIPGLEQAAAQTAAATEAATAQTATTQATATETATAQATAAEAAATQAAATDTAAATTARKRERGNVTDLEKHRTCTDQNVHSVRGCRVVHLQHRALGERGNDWHVTNPAPTHQRTWRHSKWTAYHSATRQPAHARPVVAGSSS
jgi:hypothetical protein